MERTSNYFKYNFKNSKKILDNSEDSTDNVKNKSAKKPVQICAGFFYIRYWEAPMELHLSTFVIISISFFFAGIIDAVSGGGGLLTLPTFMITGFPVHLIAGTNQCSCLLGGFTSLYKFIKSGHVYWFTASIAGINADIIEQRTVTENEKPDENDLIYC